MLYKTEYLKMKCSDCGYEEWVEADIADELTTYNKKTKSYEILLLCPECEGTMKWHNKERKVEQWEDDFNVDDIVY